MSRYSSFLFFYVNTATVCNSIELSCSIRVDYCIQLLIYIWFVHPFFSGYEYIYIFVIQTVLPRFQKGIESTLNQMDECFWGSLEIFLRHIMLSVDQFINQVKTKVYVLVVCY